jgi:hypothetical protein
MVAGGLTFTTKGGVKASVTSVTGYSHSLCAICYNGMNQGTFDGWVIRQCGKLTPMVGTYSNSFSEVPLVLDPELLFNNDPNCPITSCEILDPSCVSPFVVQEINI